MLAWHVTLSIWQEDARASAQSTLNVNIKLEITCYYFKHYSKKVKKPLRVFVKAVTFDYFFEGLITNQMYFKLGWSSCFPF